MEFVVGVSYKNKELEEVAHREYALRDYADILRLDVLRLIGDVEAFGLLLSGRAKDEWTSAERAQFDVMKHRMLDCAGEIGRLPESIHPVER